MNWWEWLITGIFGGAGGFAGTAATLTIHVIKNAEKYGPKMMQIMHKSMQKRANANISSR